jgi:hypothetical protein
MECLFAVDTSLMIGESPASQEWQRMLTAPGLVKDARNFRELIGPEFSEFQRGHVCWFSPRIFISAMIEKMPGFRKNATFDVKIDDGPVTSTSILSLDPTASDNLIDLIGDNKVEFQTLPAILIIQVGGYKEIEFPRGAKLLTLQATDEDSRNYELKSAIWSDYNFHSECEITDKPDILIYQAI